MNDKHIEKGDVVDVVCYQRFIGGLKVKYIPGGEPNDFWVLEDKDGKKLIYLQQFETITKSIGG